jgi:hypothetical protein
MVVWLRESMDAAQADAEAATPGQWHVTEYVAGSDYGFDAGVGTALGEVDVVGHGYEGGGCERVQDARHIVRHDPAAVLRRIAADRKILDLHIGDHECSIFDGPNPGDIDHYAFVLESEACDTVRLLAEGYGWTEETT